MLFKNLYNWIKYKTLPPSVLFKNRLFLERDVKNRRILSNLGLTFRNSKWSSYARPNISVKLTTNYLNVVRSLVLLLFAFFIITSLHSNYTFIETYNNLYFLWWSIVDCLIFCYLFCYFFIIFWVHTIIVQLENFYANTVTGVSVLTKPISNKLKVKSNFSCSKNDVVIPKHLHKYVLYNWLKIPQTSTKSFFENFFTEPNRFSPGVNPTSLKLIYQLANSISQTSSFNTSTSLTTPSNVSNYGTILTKPFLTETNFSDLLLDYNLRLRSSKNHPKSNKTLLIDNRCKWNMFTVNNLSTKTLVERGINGVFYVPSINFRLLNFYNSNLTYPLFTQYSLKESTQNIKTQQWLYRYNLLHRSVIKNLHNLTVSKKLMGSGFYDSKLTSHNLWAPNELGVHKDSSVIQNISSLLYNDNDVVKNNFFSTEQKNVKKNIGLTSSYQISFSWFLKRVYNLNGLQNNTPFFNYSTKKISLNQSNFLTNDLDHKNLLSFFTRSSSLTNNNFLGVFNFSDCFLRDSSNRFGSKEQLNYIEKDILFFTATNLPYNLTSLNIASWLFSNSSTSKTFCYFQTTDLPVEKRFNFTFLTLNSKGTQNTTNNFYYPANSLLEDLFLKDLKLLVNKK